MCGDSILKEMDRQRKRFPVSPSQLDSYMVWKPGTTPYPNESLPLSTYSMDRNTYHQGQVLPYPARESCPGGPPAAAAASPAMPTQDRFPPGVPEVSLGFVCLFVCLF